MMMECCCIHSKTISCLQSENVLFHLRDQKLGSFQVRETATKDASRLSHCCLYQITHLLTCDKNCYVHDAGQQKMGQKYWAKLPAFDLEIDQLCKFAIV